MQRETFILELTAAKMITPEVRHLEFQRANGKTFKFIAGQFITFHFEVDGDPLQRSYSIASIPGRTDKIEIAVAPYGDGPGTKLLFGIQPGDTLETTGPFGRLILRDEQPKRYFFIATGTGVTPYRAMLPELLNRLNTHDLEVYIFLGVQKPSDLLYGADFLEFTQKHPKLHFHAFYSREMPADSQTHAHKGYVQTGLESANLDPQNDIVYLCGNPNMIDQTFALLREQGFATQNVRREKYISPKQRG